MTNEGMKPRLAIVSTFDDLCGIAGYTRALVRQLEPYFDIEVFDLDQFFMRSTDRNVRKLADTIVGDFCLRFRDFNFVNIQLEHGTLGRKIRDISRRFAMIAESAPALSVTFHSVLSQEPLELGLLIKNIALLKFALAADIFTKFIARRILTKGMYRLLRNLQRHKPINIIVHTRRDMRIMKYVNKFDCVFDHPLAFIPSTEAEKYRNSLNATNVAGLKELPLDAKTVGVFGFLSEYKGVDTVIRAMHELPDNYHLLIFGGLHPNEIKKGQLIHPYVKTLLDEANVGVSIVDKLKQPNVVIQVSGQSSDFIIKHPKDIGRRIHFLGPQTDEGFAAHMSICDHVVLPYHEVGQTSSGVLSIAVEMQSRVIAARNLAFIQFTRYHPDTIELFEIGNFLELAEKIMAKPAYPLNKRKSNYNVETNTQMYIAANTGSAVKAERTVQIVRSGRGVAV